MHGDVYDYYLIAYSMQYLGPSPLQLIFLFIYSVVNTAILFALAILLVRNIWCLGANVTTIEGWEIERHETLLRRARVSGGSLDGPNGIKVKIVRQEFPYDIGIFKNISQAMGGNPLLWLWPFARSLFIGDGLQFEINGFEGKLFKSHLSLTRSHCSRSFDVVATA